MDKIRTQFPRLVTIKSIEEFLDKVTLHFEKLAPLAQQFLEEHLGEIEDNLKEHFEYLGFVLADQDGDVSEINVKRIGDIHAYLISLEQDENGTSAMAHFELTTSITYIADVSYANLKTASYDSEDKVLIPWETVERTVVGSEVIQANLKFSFSVNEPHQCKLVKLDLQTPNEVLVTTEDYDFHD